MWRSLRSGKAGSGRRNREEEGVVLLLVLLVLALISVLVMGWAQEWRTELQLAANYREAHQCRRLAEAGVYYALGKLIEGKVLEIKMTGGDQEATARFAQSWRGDQSVHELKLPGGLVAVRLEDEGGKFNVNQANEDILARLFTNLGFSQTQIPIMVDSLQDWRSKGDQPRPNGAKSPYYMKLDPPYVCRNGPLEVVEELGWVRGFEVSPLIPRLGDWLTVQLTGQGININAAPLEVLVAIGIPPDVARAIIVTRQQQPFRSYQDIAPLGLAAMPTTGGQAILPTFQTSPFFTIKSTGMVNKQGGRKTVKAVIRLDLSLQNAWEILSWVDDFPG